MIKELPHCHEFPLSVLPRILDALFCDWLMVCSWYQLLLHWNIHVFFHNNFTSHEGQTYSWCCVWYLVHILQIHRTPLQIICWPKGCKDGKQGLNILQMQCPISISVSMPKVFNLLYEVDESVPIFQGFIAILSIINEMVKVTDEVRTVFPQRPTKELNFHHFPASYDAYLVQVLKRNTTCTTMDQLRIQ